MKGVLLPRGYPKTNRWKQRLNSGWKFLLGHPDGEFHGLEVDSGEWMSVSIPHTLQLTSLALDGCTDDKTQETFHRHVGWYRKTLYLPAEMQGKKVFIEFEGVHQVTDLWVNGRWAGQHDVGGYTPFIFDITRLLQYDCENILTLRVDNRRREDVPPDPGPFDYIKFSGVYRDVHLVVTDPLHVSFNIEGLRSGVTITTPSVDPVNGNATIDVKVEVVNESSTQRTASVINRVVGQDGRVALKMCSTAKIAPGQRHLFEQIGGIENNVRFWSIDDPYLYHVNTLVMDGEVSVDCVDNKLGLRKFELDPEAGFRLNGKQIDLIGFNRHQHCGYIGDALPNSLHYQDMLQFKELGFNVVRTAHYPQDDALIEACDELGILVYEEPPTWIGIPQNEQWYERLETAARVMVRNHRNHPSIVIWGAGINHRGCVPTVHYAIKQEDPTRLTASQGSQWTGWQTSGHADVYANMLYGTGIWERHEPLLGMEGRYGPEVIAKCRRDPLMLGMISWTAHAYYTFHQLEDGEDRTRSGAMDIFRRCKNPVLWWYPTELKPEPAVYIHGTWQQGEEILIYSNCEEIDLLVNDQPVKTCRPSQALKYQGLHHPPFVPNIQDFSPGKLTVRGKINGAIVVEKSIYTPKAPAAVRLSLDMKGRTLVADGADIVIGHAEIIDENGTVIENYQGKAEFSLVGDATIVGDGAGIGANPVTIRRGAAPVLLRAGHQPSDITLTACVANLRPDSVQVRTTASQPNLTLATAYPIFDGEKLQVDIGGKSQLLQFGWKAWFGLEGEPCQLDLGWVEAQASIHCLSNEGVLRWLGEMNVIGKNGYVYGDGVLALGGQGMVLRFTGLPAGQCFLTTYHHAPSSNTDPMDPNRRNLQTEKIHKLPYAHLLQARISDAAGETVQKNIRVTAGKDMQFEEPGKMVTAFVADGQHPVEIVLQDQAGESGVWLNGFELELFRHSCHGTVEPS